jgi:heme oxygenase
MQALSTRLRDETEALHREAERSGYVSDILSRRASKEGYALYLRALEPAYAALENALADKAAEPPLNLFAWPALRRSRAIALDLAALAGAGWREALPILDESDAYARRIEHIGLTAPARLIAHGYVRYIGDLSGGRIVETILRKIPGLAGDMLRFYEFPEITDIDGYKDEFRIALDRAGERGADPDAIIDEARRAFRLNIDVSVAVQRAIDQA